MKPPHLLCVVSLAILAAGFAGCATSARQNSRAAASLRQRSFALAVTVQGGLQPTPAQWAAIQAKVAQSLALRGWVLVTDIGLADHILRIDFTPNPNDPENSGHARLLSVRNNPLSTVARHGTSPYPTGFGYSSAHNPSWWNTSLYSGSYYGYGNFYNDGYSPGWATVTPVTTTPVTPPYRHPPGNRNDCPPEYGVRPLPGVFAGNFTPTVINDHPRPPPSDYGRWGGERSSSRSDRSNRSYSRSDSSYSRSDSSYSRAESSYSRHESSYSPSYSSSSSYSSSDSYSASSSSSASSAAASAASSAASSSEPVVVSSTP